MYMASAMVVALAVVNVDGSGGSGCTVVISPAVSFIAVALWLGYGKSWFEVKSC